MPIGAIIGGVGAVASAGASIYSANKASSTAQKAAAQNAQTIASTQASNNQLFQPYIQRGNTAGDAINSLLGLSPSVGKGATAAAPGSPDWSTFVNDPQNSDLMGAYNANKGLFDSPEAFAQQWYASSPKDRPLPTYGQTAGANDNSASNAFNTYLNSTGHQFRLTTGVNAINQNKSTAGLLNSGSTLKALTKYGQDVGTQDFQSYLGNLQGQQSAGLSATSGNASSNSNILGTSVANTDSAASASANAALSTGSNISNVLGQAISAYGYSKGASSYTKTGTGR